MQLITKERGARLQRVDLVVGEAALHGAVGDAEAVGGALRLGVRERVHQRHALRQVPRHPPHHLRAFEDGKLREGNTYCTDFVFPINLNNKSKLKNRII